MRQLKPNANSRALKRALRHQQVLALLFIVTLSFAVRALTANFLRSHLNDPGWFPSGIYRVFDEQARNSLDGNAPLFWINDSSQTDKATYPPGYALWLTFIYKVTGSRSVLTIQRIQCLLDSFSVLLIVGLGATYGWRVGLWAGIVAALWPLLALYGVTPLPDAPTAWLVVGATWAFVVSLKRRSYRWAILAGAVVGLSCWLRANAILLPLFLGVAMLFAASVSRRLGILVPTIFAITALMVISPIIVRNAIVFHSFIPVGLGTGTNLWEGLGENERGVSEFGAAYGDENLMAQEKSQLPNSNQEPFGLYYPDGIHRDRERTAKALGVIARHPFWYSGIMIRRMANVLKYAGAPNGIYGSSGVNVTSEKCLSIPQQRGLVAFFVKMLGMVQSLLRYALLPLMICGVIIAVRRDAPVTVILLMVVFYYLVIGSFLHTQFRYVLPMHMLLTIFAGISLAAAQHVVQRRFRTKASLRP